MSSAAGRVGVICLLKFDEVIWTALKEGERPIILVSTKEDREAYAAVQGPCQDVFEISRFDSIEDLAAVGACLLSSGRRIDAVVSHREATQYPAGFLRDVLGVHGPSARETLRYRNKLVMKTLLGQRGVACPRFVATRYDSLHSQWPEIVAALGCPLVIKPAAGVAAYSTFVVESADEYFAKLAVSAARPQHYHSDISLIAEEFVDGEEYHIEAVWRNREALLFNVSKYFAPSLEMKSGRALHGGFHLPPDEFGEFYNQARALHNEVNEILGIEHGWTHLEFFVERQSGRLVFSEVATRVAGGVIDWVIERKFGITTRRLWSLQLAGIDQSPRSPLPGTPKYIGRVAVVPARSGVITRLPTDGEMYVGPPGAVCQTLQEGGRLL